MYIGLPDPVESELEKVLESEFPVTPIKEKSRLKRLASMLMRPCKYFNLPTPESGGQGQSHISLNVLSFHFPVSSRKNSAKVAPITQPQRALHSPPQDNEESKLKLILQSIFQF